MLFSISRHQLKALLMTIILGADSVILTSAWIFSSTDASVAAATTTGILKPADPKDTTTTTSDFSSLKNHQIMYKEAPLGGIPAAIQRLPFLFHDWDVKFPPIRNIFTNSPRTPNPSSSSESSSESAWFHSLQGDSIPCTYKPIWDWQLDYFQQHLTNFQEVVLPDPSLAVVQTTGEEKKPATRVRTKWYSSDEYRLIRMTYMDGGETTQIFTTVCYPRTTQMPIMGHGLLQVGDRRITISDFQPLLEEHGDIAKKYLQPIQEQYPSLNQEMSERFFQQGEFWSDYTLLGRFSKSQDDEQMWKDLWPAYKACIQTHAQLCRQEESSNQNHRKNEVSSNNDLLLEHHAAYDAHVASRDPAIKMLTGIFGPEMATKVVYEALFPLADPPSTIISSSSRQ